MRSAKIFAALLFVATGLGSVQSAEAKSKVRVFKFSKAGSWNIRSVFMTRTGRFDHCSANAVYKSGTRVSLIVYRSGNWRLWFSHKNWPDRGRAPFDATVRVDGRTVLSQTGYYKNRNAYIDLGRRAKRVRALMRGREMSVTTPNGTSRFRLTGTFKASRDAARCWTANYRRNLNGNNNNSASGGAFGGGSANNGGGAFGGGRANNNSGAFGGGNIARPKRANVLSRASTIELATRYLSKANQPYSILPQNKSPLKHFTVNWKYRSGAIGGMKVFKNTSVSVDKVLSSLLSDQAKHCKGRNASEKQPQREVRGRRIARARGVCDTNKGSVLNITYRVAELGRQTVMMIMEVKSKKVAGAGTGAQSGGQQGDGSIYVPGPNEL